MDSLLSQATNLSLAPSERILQLTPISPNSQERSYSLMGRMITSKQISMSTMKGASRRPWSKAGVIDYKSVGENTFVFTFSSEANREIVWEKRPWVIADHLLALKKVDELANPDNVSFDSIDLWVQMHNFPAKFKSLENVKMVANSYFKFLEVDRAGLQPGTWNRFIRVMVEVDIREPLPECFFIPSELSRDKVDFIYEKVNERCTACQRIGHTGFMCQEDPGSPFVTPDGYLRSPGGTHLGKLRSPVPARIQSTPHNEQSLSPSNGNNCGSQDRVRTAGPSIPTASSRVQKGDEGSYQSAKEHNNCQTIGTNDLFPQGFETPYNSKGVKKAVGFIAPRVLERDMREEVEDRVFLSPMATSGLPFPPGFGPQTTPGLSWETNRPTSGRGTADTPLPF
ncbi:hypothetical protein LINPERHAP2_LOCUS12479 [Linum perenne]